VASAEDAAGNPAPHGDGVIGRRRHTASRRVGGVVIGGDYQGLGIVRSLGRHGVPVCVVDDERSIARFSHYTTHSVRVEDLRDERRTVDALLDLAPRLGLDGWVLYPTREETVAALSRHKEELSGTFRVPTADWSAVRYAWDKRNTYHLAGELGIPTPRTWYPRSGMESEAIDGEPPFAVKPAIKEHFIYATKAKAWRADTKEELVRLVDRAAGLVDSGEVMVQEVIPGDGGHQLAYCAFFKDGEAVGSMVARRRRQHPPDFGRASTFVETIELPLLESLSLRFLRAIGYYGLVELEYKLDPRDGLHKLLDVNARTWGYHSLGVRAGVDFPYLLYTDQLGERVEALRADANVRWVRLATDVPVAVAEIVRGRMSFRAYIDSLRSSDVEAVFTREDLLPGLAELLLIPYLAVKRGF
jgi:D-aspartate ligase